jgi:hypothetical protein
MAITASLTKSRLSREIRSRDARSVPFELLAAAPVGFHDLMFRVRLYEIPHPEPETDSDAA